MWKPQEHWVLAVTSRVLIPALIAWVHAQEMTPNPPPHPKGKSTPMPAQDMPPDEAVAPAQPPQPVPKERPEPLLIAHDPSAVFQALPAQPVSPAVANLPDDGKLVGVDGYCDPLDVSAAEAAGGPV